MGKSAAKIRRNTARAMARGETYSPPATRPPKSDKVDGSADAIDECGAGGGVGVDVVVGGGTMSTSKRATSAPSSSASASASSLSGEDKKRYDAAKKLRESLSKLEEDAEMNAKERRSAKRRAMAIASEEIGGNEVIGKLLEWYDTMTPPPPPPPPTKKKRTKRNDDDGDDDGGGGDDAKEGVARKRKVPYILFVGQLSYGTTSDMLFEHFRAALGSDVITRESVKIRLLVDTKNKKNGKGNNKSRGMAFVELDSPEVMYECLKLHLTHLDGRRINVERSAGGGTTAKKARITSFRESQTTFISNTMDSILSGFVRDGEISPEELDEGVIRLCKRHSATVVEAALKEYVNEKRERRIKRDTLGEKEEEVLRNPSAFLTHMIGRIAEEGIGNSSLIKKNRGDGDCGRGGGPGRGGGGGRGGRGGSGGGDGRGRVKETTSSILQRDGVDMSISSKGGADSRGERCDDISQIFPSMRRGRGRGRGYM
ncbi:hypothetical protein ACHAXA_004801 [Cyclostephanos tholiformis]|uniref:RRM domain-containing protein n=1 Tax=Cyclostephanos tholiformis TaxID=382380 RepID=A0ABD3RWN9_9STRA